MGLLDDAIREHLDLKRRRGADPAEVERAEREALGPVRRGPEGPEQVGLEEPLAYDREAEEQWEEPFDEDDEDFPMQETVQPQPFEMDEPHLVEPPPPRAAAPPGHFDEFEQEPPSATTERFVERFVDAEPSTRPASRAASDAGAPEHRGGETVEYEVEGALEEEGGKHADDMLEETPDFLQDTPDHDRLWFEQRSPRDFDFDG